MRFDDTPTAFSAARAPGPAARPPAPRSGGQGRFLLRKAGFAALMAVLSACTSDGLELEPSAQLDPDRPAPARASSGALEPPPGPAAPPLAEPEPEGAIGPAASSSGYPASHGRARLPAAEPMSAPLQSTAPPSEGVDVDGMLGEPVVRGLAEEEADQIAEGRTSQPVVDGIGGQVHAVAPRLPAPESGPPPAIDPDLPPLPPRAGAARAERRTDARPMARAGEDQVAFVPRLVPKSDAPMSLPAPPQGAMPAEEAACRRQLQALGVTYREVPRISNGPACGIDHPVKVSGLSGNIAVSPAVTLNCRTTVAFAAWVKNELAPAARLRYLSGVAVVKPMGGYSCRPMNNRRGNPMSEHAHGNAIDIGTFILKNGKEIDVRKPGFFAFREKGLLKAVRADSCKYFNTVLGPGSDPQHKDHFHFDLRDRRSGYRHCD